MVNVTDSIATYCNSKIYTLGVNMKKLRYFKCDACSASTERLVKDSELTVKCECRGEAKRMLSAPRCFDNTTGGSPSSNYKR